MGFRFSELVCVGLNFGCLIESFRGGGIVGGC